MLRFGLVGLVILGGCNKPPGEPLISISPAAPFSGDDLQLVFDAQAMDLNSKDVLTYDIVWQRDGTDMPDLAGEMLVPAAQTRRGQQWTARVYAWDGKLAGSTVEAEVSVQNSVPQVLEVTLTPDAVRTDDVLTARYQFVDADDDIPDENFNWRINGDRVDVRSNKLEGRLWFDKGDRVTVGVTLSDLDSESDELVSDSITVGNTAPGGIEIALSPIEPTVGADIQCQITTEATDVDSDTLDYRFTWAINDVETAAETSSAYAGDTMRGRETSVDDVVRCTAAAFDGEDEGPSATTTVEVTQAVVPGFDGELGPKFGGWLQCAGYLDRTAGDDIPDRWADDCAGAEYNRLKLVCGESDTTWRAFDVSKNVFRMGLTGYPETGLISNTVDSLGTPYSAGSNQIYASNANNPSSGRSWWVVGTGCDESSQSLTVNNSCPWEASNCMGQNLAGSRYLYVYVAP